jgi:hypothetical protein
VAILKENDGISIMDPNTKNIVQEEVQESLETVRKISQLNKELEKFKQLNKF